MKRSILPIFIPHLGCPHNCIFCDQKQIAVPHVPTPPEVRHLIEEGLRYAQKPQISFYGGSFTAIPQDEMRGYLKAAYAYVSDGRADSIRLSTRPDAVDGEILELLRHYGVRTIELGAQSMSDAVLQKAGRGHTAEDTRQAAKSIRDHGFELILQMMVGLPGSTPADEIETARALAQLHPDGVRIYPTCVLEHTPLCSLWVQGKYEALTVERAAEICAELCEIFEAADIPVIRLGLNPTEELSNGAVKAGPYHPAFGELVYGERFYRRMLPQLPKTGAFEIVVPPKMLSVAIGQQKRNLRRFSAAADIRAIRAENGCTEPEIRKV